MIIVKVKEGENIDRALKRYKAKFRRIKVIDELRDRKQFTKKSAKRREEIKKAKYLDKKRIKEENDSGNG